jgi:hypothetical protein
MVGPLGGARIHHEHGDDLNTARNHRSSRSAAWPTRARSGLDSRDGPGDLTCSMSLHVSDASRCDPYLAGAVGRHDLSEPRES